MKNRNTKTNTTAKLDVKLAYGPRMNDAWTHGTATVNGTVYAFDVKHFDEGSDWGLKGGCISKLGINTNTEGCVVNFDRGWDRRPQTEETKAVFKALVARFNKPGAEKNKAHRDTTYTEADLEAAAEDLKRKTLAFYRLRAKSWAHPLSVTLFTESKNAFRVMNEAEDHLEAVAREAL